MTGEQEDEQEYLIALISATPVAIPPAQEALAERFPRVRVWNVLDDMLLPDAAQAGGLTEPLQDRMRRLITHAVQGGADGVLLTCSMYGPVAQEAQSTVPVLAPDEAAFADVTAGGYGQVLVVASMESALADSVERLRAYAASAGVQMQIDGLAEPAAFDAANSGDTEALVSALAQACGPRMQDVDAVLLAQYSLAPVQSELHELLGKPVISSPSSAANRLLAELSPAHATDDDGALTAEAADDGGALATEVADGGAHVTPEGHDGGGALVTEAADGGARRTPEAADGDGPVAHDRRPASEASQHETAPLIGAIADDYTGATDVALAFRRAGLRTLLFFGTPPPGIRLPEHDAIVIALKSRTTPVPQAVGDAVAAGAWLEERGVPQVYFKYCSTFDSTPEGNIGPVLDALSEQWGVAAVLTTPSSPEHQRTVYQGQLFVQDTLLADTHMAHHPLTPMTDSFLPRVLQAQTVHPVAQLQWPTVRSGVEAVQRALAEAPAAGAHYLLADAITEQDLLTLAGAVSEHRLVSGAAGLAGALAQVHAGSDRHLPGSPAAPAPGRSDPVRGADGSGSAAPEPMASDPVAPDPVGPGLAAVLGGSCSARTLEQIDHFERDGHPSYRVDARTAETPAQLAESALHWVDALPARSTPLIYTSLPPAELQAVQHALGTDASAQLLEAALSLIAVGLVERGYRRLITAGGETSGAIVDALQVDGAVLGADVAPGVPWIYTLGTDPLALLLKSGNFGDPAMFSRAVDPTQNWGVQP